MSRRTRSARAAAAISHRATRSECQRDSHRRRASRRCGGSCHKRPDAVKHVAQTALRVIARGGNGTSTCVPCGVDHQASNPSRRGRSADGPAACKTTDGCLAVGREYVTAWVSQTQAGLGLSAERSDPLIARLVCHGRQRPMGDASVGQRRGGCCATPWAPSLLASHATPNPA